MVWTDMHIRIVSIIKHISQTFGVPLLENGVDAVVAAVALTILCGKICFVVGKYATLFGQCAKNLAKTKKVFTIQYTNTCMCVYMHTPQYTYADRRKNNNNKKQISIRQTHSGYFVDKSRQRPP